MIYNYRVIILNINFFSKIKIDILIIYNTLFIFIKIMTTFNSIICAPIITNILQFLKVSYNRYINESPYINDIFNFKLLNKKCYNMFQKIAPLLDIILINPTNYHIEKHSNCKLYLVNPQINTIVKPNINIITIQSTYTIDIDMFKNAKSLKYLYLKRGSIKDHHFENFPNIECLEICDNKYIQGSSFNKLKKLNCLIIKNCENINYNYICDLPIKTLIMTLSSNMNNNNIVKKLIESNYLENIFIKCDNIINIYDMIIGKNLKSVEIYGCVQGINIKGFNEKILSIPYSNMFFYSYTKN